MTSAPRQNPLLAQRAEQRILLVLVTGDKGLAGAFNSTLIKGGAALHRRAWRRDRSVGTDRTQGPRFLPQARRARSPGDHVGLAAKVAYAETSAIARQAMELFQNDEIDAVYLLYNEFKSVVAQRLMLSRVLPVEMPEQTTPVDYIYEQPPAEMLEALLPRYVEMEFYRALLESAAAEHAARMTAMEAATSNAGDMIDKLTLYMNRVRQASITKEIIEVVSGAAAAE